MVNKTVLLPERVYMLLSDRPTAGGGGANRGYFPAAPKLLRGPCGFYFYDFYFYGLDLHAVSLSFALHCLDSMSERLGRIISNGFTVSIDKHFDVRRTPLFY